METRLETRLESVEKIFFDMDGVLADFNRGVRELCGMEPAPQGPDWKPGADDPMWEGIKKVDRFYAQLEPVPGSIELYRRLRDKYGDRVQILTGIPKPKRQLFTSGEDKTSWAHRLMDEDLIVNIVFREEKPKYCTGKGCILIDDFDENIRDWTACGGTGIRFTTAEEAEKILEAIGVL